MSSVLLYSVRTTYFNLRLLGHHISSLFLLLLLLLPSACSETSAPSHITHSASDWLIIQGIRGKNKGLKKFKENNKKDNMKREWWSEITIKQFDELDKSILLYRKQEKRT
jgi:hypothetical protein